MGKVFSTITRPIRNFNIESRAHKVISQDKPTPAPKYKANIDEAERILREYPDSLKELLRKDSALDNRLKDVYVTSHDPIVDMQAPQTSTDRPKPSNRSFARQLEFGFHEPVSVPIGKCTLRQALKFLTQHQEDSTTWNSTKIALDNKISEDIIKNILYYFRIYKVYIPDKKSKIILAEPSIPKSSLKNIKQKVLENKSEDETK